MSRAVASAIGDPIAVMTCMASRGFRGSGAGCCATSLACGTSVGARRTTAAMSLRIRRAGEPLCRGGGGRLRVVPEQGTVGTPVRLGTDHDADRGLGLWWRLLGHDESDGVARLA